MGDIWHLVAGIALIAVAVYGISRYPALLYRSVKEMQGGGGVFPRSC